MDVNERRYKIVKLQKYNEEIREKESKINSTTVTLFAASIISLCFITIATKTTPNEAMFYISSALGATGSLVSYKLIRNLVPLIISKSSLKLKADKLIEDIESSNYTKGGR